MLTPSPGRRMVAALLLAVAVAACSESTTPSQTKSNTPQVSFAVGTASEHAALLTTADLRSVAGVPDDATVVPTDQQKPVYQNPDPRGFCGATVSYPDISSGASEQLAASTFSGFESIVDLPVGQATMFVADLQADSRPGCSLYQSITNTGATQTVKLAGSIRMPDSVDQATGGVLTITVQGETVVAYVLVLRQGGRVASVEVTAPAVLPEGSGQGLAAVIGRELEASVSTP